MILKESLLTRQLTGKLKREHHINCGHEAIHRIFHEHGIVKKRYNGHKRKKGFICYKEKSVTDN